VRSAMIIALWIGEDPADPPDVASTLLLITPGAAAWGGSETQRDRGASARDATFSSGATDKREDL